MVAKNRVSEINSDNFWERERETAMCILLEEWEERK
jgi:hypothetical protein